MSPARLEFGQGREHLACLRLTEKGPLRWYAACCRTPLANTPPFAQAPFAGVLRSFVVGDAAALPPVNDRIMGKEALDGPATETRMHPGFPPGLLVRLLTRVLGWRLRGDHRRSPFFDTSSGEPVAAPAMPEGS